MELDSTAVVQGIAITVGAAILVASIHYCIKALRQSRSRRKAIVRIITREDKQLPPHWDLWIRHVRDGKDEHDEKGDLLNNEYKFKSVSSTEWVVSFRCSRNLGCQFKCFIAVPLGQESKVAKWIEDQSFEDLTDDDDRARHYWFLIPGVPRYQTTDRPKPYTNNYLNPNVPEICYKANDPGTD